jgi:hypothetical protein
VTKEKEADDESEWTRVTKRKERVAYANKPSYDESEWTLVTKRKERVAYANKPSSISRNIASISLEQDRQISGVSNLKGEWEVIKVTVDSGAVDTVTPPHTAKYFPILDTDASRKGLDYRAANGTKIKNHGARNVTGISSEFKEMNLIMNVADVKKTLASAYQIVAAGNKVILDIEHSYIVNKATGEKTAINIENGEFNFDLWVPAPHPEQPPLKYANGVYTEIVTEEDESERPNQTVFPRQEHRK